MEEKIIENIALIIEKFIEKQETYDFEPALFDSLLYDIINCIIKEKNLENYINEAKIEDCCRINQSYNGLVEPNNNLFIFREGIEENIRNTLNKAPYLSDFEILMCRIVLYVKTIIHELQHINENKILDDDPENKSIVTLIIRLSKNGEDNSNNDGRQILYYLQPAERIAELTAYDSIARISEKFGSRTKNLTNRIKSYEMQEKLDNYYNWGLCGTTMLYLNGFGNKNKVSLLKQRIENENISFEDRLLCGLEITEDEYDDLVMKYDVIYKELEKVSGKKHNK